MTPRTCTTCGTGRWTCETCGADLGTSDDRAAPDFARCPERTASLTLWPPAPSDYNRGIADAVAAVTGSLARARARRAPLDVIDVLYGARDAVAALKRGSE